MLLLFDLHRVIIKCRLMDPHTKTKLFELDWIGAYNNFHLLWTFADETSSPERLMYISVVV